MSKKKNTLKDLDEFLKQQAAILVSPSKLSDTAQPAKTEAEKVQDPTPEPSVANPDDSISVEQLLSYLQQLAKKEGSQFRPQFYDLIIQHIELQNQYSPEDKMLINTALYLKGGENWKETIRAYWRKKG